MHGTSNRLYALQGHVLVHCSLFDCFIIVCMRCVCQCLLNEYTTTATAAAAAATTAATTTSYLSVKASFNFVYLNRKEQIPTRHAAAKCGK